MRIARALAKQAVRRLIWALLCAVAAGLSLVPPASAAAQLTGTFVGLDPLRHQFVRFTRPDGRVVNDQAGVIQLRLDKSSPGDRQGPLLSVFCIELFVTVGTHPFPTETYFSNGSVNTLPRGAYIRYLLAHYPAATVAATDTAEAAARQLAIWHFSDRLDLSTVQDANIRARAIALANEAQTWIDLNGPLPTVSEAATISIAPSSATVQPGQPASYTVSITPPNAAATVQLSVDGTAAFDNGQQQVTLALNQGSASFNVVNPDVGIATVTALLPFILDAGTVFDSTRNPPTQRLVLGDGVSLSATATVQTTWQQGGATPTRTDTPVAPTSTPAAATSTPVAETSTPTGPANTPGGAPETPGVPTNTPAVETSTPSGATSTPTSRPTTKSSGSAPKRSPTPAPAQTPESLASATPQANQPGAPSGPGDTASPPAVELGSPGVGGSAPVGAPAPGDTATQGQAAPASPRPRSLPRTAGAPGTPLQSLVLAGLVLTISGAILRRRGHCRQ